MYESFFECRQRPFAAAPQVDRYFPGRTIEAARQAVERCLERSEGTAIVCGPAGIGKTLLTAKVVAHFRETFAVAVLSGGGLTSRRAFLQALLYELGLPYRNQEEGELRLSLADRLTGASADRSLLLAVDDAHLLPLRLLEEIRMLTDHSFRGEARVRTLLVGASSFEERLTSPRLAALQQRITTRAYLEALDRNDSLAYIRHQIVQAGGDPLRIFTDAALEAVLRATEGIPRLINQTCDHALVMACAGGVKPIDAAGIEEAWADLQQLPTPWSQAKGYAGLGDALPPVEWGPTAHDESKAGHKPLTHAPVAHEPAGADVIEFVTAPPGSIERMTHDTLNVIETQLAEWESEFTPVAKSEPEVELRFDSGRGDPFAEDFVEEEVVVDRYASTDRVRHAPRVQVYGADAMLLSTLFETQQTLKEAQALHVAETMKPPTIAAGTAAEARSHEDGELEDAIVAGPSPHARFAKHSDPVEPEDMVIIPKRSTSDADMIIIEDDPIIDAAGVSETTVVRKKDYRQMFAKLRRGN
jgi:type II secretory pathway predicted ATPase ExeA